MKTQKTARISANDIADLAAQGVARALEARQAAGIELTANEIEEVSGALLYPGIIAGGIPPGPWLQNSIGNQVGQLSNLQTALA